MLKDIFMSELERKGNVLYDKDGSAVTVFTKDNKTLPKIPCMEGYEWVYLNTLQGWHRERITPPVKG